MRRFSIRMRRFVFWNARFRNSIAAHGTRRKRWRANRWMRIGTAAAAAHQSIAGSPNIATIETFDLDAARYDDSGIAIGREVSRTTKSIGRPCTRS